MLYMYAVVARAQPIIETLFQSHRRPFVHDESLSFNELVAMLTESLFYVTFDELTRTPYGQLAEHHVFRKYISSRHCPSATRPVYDLIGVEVETAALMATQSFMTVLYNEKIYPITLGVKCSAATAQRLKGDGLFWNVRFEVKEPN